MVELAGLANSAITVVVLIVVALVVLAIGGLGVWAYLRWKKFQQYRVIIWERDGFGQLQETYDRAGIFVDGKTKNKRFFLRKANVGLDPDQVPYLPGGKNKVVYLYRTGLKNFRFIKPRIQEKSMSLEVGEEDVNWAVNAYERQKKLFSNSIWMQIMPYMVIAFVSIVILIIFIYFFRQFGTLQQTAVALHEAAQALAQASGASIVIPA